VGVVFLVVHGFPLKNCSTGLFFLRGNLEVVSACL